jgi:hypothetical protein
MKSKFNGYFVKRPLAMMQSPAFRALSLTGHRILARIEIEHCNHRGKDNGQLPVTHQNFRRFGIDRDAVGPGLREVEALGFTEVTQHGLAGNAEFRRPNMFRLTYLETQGMEPTNEWAAIATNEEADAIAATARARKARKDTKMREFYSQGKTQTQSGFPRPRTASFQSGFPGVMGENSQSGKPGVLSRYLPISSEGCAEPGPDAPEPAPRPSPAAAPTPIPTEATDPAAEPGMTQAAPASPTLSLRRLRSCLLSTTCAEIIFS